MIRFLKSILGIENKPLSAAKQMAILEAKEAASKKEPVIAKKEDIVEEDIIEEEYVYVDIPSETEMTNMTKAELEEMGRTLGIELDRRLKKEKLIEQLQNFMNDETN